MKSRSPESAKHHGAAAEVATTPLPPRDAVILALLVLGIGVAAIVGVWSQPPPRTTVSRVVTTPAPLMTIAAGTVVSPTASSAMPFSNAWQIFASYPHGYHISVPATWTVQPDFPNAGDFFASYVPSPGGPPVPLAQGDVPPQEAEVDIVVLSPPPPTATEGDPFCVGSICRLRLQQTPRWACTDPTCVQQLAAQPREVNIQLLKDSRLYRIHATIGGPPSTIDRNAETVDAILQTFMFDN